MIAAQVKRAARAESCEKPSNCRSVFSIGVLSPSGWASICAWLMLEEKTPVGGRIVLRTASNFWNSGVAIAGAVPSFVKSEGSRRSARPAGSAARPSGRAS